MDPICKPVVPAAILFRRQRKWVQENSKPKRIPQPPKLQRGPIFSNPEHLGEMSIPRYKYIKPKNDPTRWEYIINHLVKESALNYVASGRICEMALPRPPITPKHKWERYRCTPPKKTQMAQMSERMQHLCLPRVPYKKFKPKRLVSRKALKYKASKRILELAKPQVKTNEINEFAFTVNPTALKYNPSKRTRLMAKPHHQFTEQDIKDREEKRMRRKLAYDQRRAAKLAKEKEKIAQRHRQEAKSLGL